MQKMVRMLYLVVLQYAFYAFHFHCEARTIAGPIQPGQTVQGPISIPKRGSEGT